ncbi:hypothetical protein [Chitinophaga sp. Cy-1792]|uniref:hypothetical protein n=1 Tax=Chitinophaga sp. Cy-1792 TaxID=2608339 RepID=UPI00141F0295|nr:hypothetical protein [Chitinophaga sp. Cy-1792]NIG57334.1 hypothetical protein [Chitinophaga sp. Cy-1792]
MKTLLLLVSAALVSCTAMAQTVIKVPPPEKPFTDSIVYEGENATIIINRQDVMDYMNTLDTSLPRQQYSGRAINHLTFVKFSKADMAAHFQKAFCFLADSSHTDIRYVSTKMYMIWDEDEGILLPYLESIMADLLNAAKVKVIQKFAMPKLPVTSYKLIVEPVNGRSFRVFRLNDGKQIFRESTYAAEEQLARRF